MIENSLLDEIRYNGINVIEEIFNVKVNQPLEKDISNEAVIQGISKSNKFIDNGKMRANLRSVAGIGATEEENKFAQKRLNFELSGPIPLKPIPKQSVRHVSSLKPTLMTPIELSDIKISELEGRVDNLDAEHTNVIKNGAELGSNIEKLKERTVSNELIERGKQQLNDTI